MKKKKDTISRIRFLQGFQELKDRGAFESMNFEGLRYYTESFLRKIKNFFIPETRNKNVASTLYVKYDTWLNEGYRKNHKDLRGYTLDDIRPDLRKELQKRTYEALSKIDIDDKELMNKLEDIFVHWVVDEPDKAGEKSEKNLKKRLKLTKEEKEKRKKIQRIMIDQSMKLQSNLDNIIARSHQAVGFIWKTRRDDKVAGNPAGKYPNVDKNSTVHGDHYSRQDKIYFFRDNNWALENGLLDKANIEYAEFPDGLPGQPLNCRCYASYIYDLYDLPASMLSVKGIRYVRQR